MLVCAFVEFLDPSHNGGYPCECQNVIFAANSPKIIRLARIVTETSEALKGL